MLSLMSGIGEIVIHMYYIGDIQLKLEEMQKTSQVNER